MAFPHGTMKGPSLDSLRKKHVMGHNIQFKRSISHPSSFFMTNMQFLQRPRSQEVMKLHFNNQSELHPKYSGVYIT